MSLSTREQLALRSIDAELTSSDPGLAARMSMFARLASGEEMPAAEKIRLPRWQYGAGPGGRGRPRREPSRRRILATERTRCAFRFARVALCVLAVVASLIGFTLAFNHGGHGGCPNGRFAACTGQVASRTVSSHPGVLSGG